MYKSSNGFWSQSTPHRLRARLQRRIWVQVRRLRRIAHRMIGNEVHSQKSSRATQDSLEEFLPDEDCEFIKELWRYSERASGVQKRGAYRRVERLRMRLRDLGFTQRPVLELARLSDQARKPFRRRLASWELAIWHCDQRTQKDAAAALSYLDVAVSNARPLKGHWKVALIRAQCLAVLGKKSRAKRLLSKAFKRCHKPALAIAMMNLRDSPQSKLSWLNKALECNGLQALSSFPDLPLLAECSGPKPERHRREPGRPTVSVMLDVHNGAAGIKTAVEDVLGQSWAPLEVIVVDRGSTDRTTSIVEELARRDPRIKLIQMESDGGRYIARSRALEIAAGDIVASHDWRSWSHPESIEKAVHRLSEDERLVGVMGPTLLLASNMSAHSEFATSYYSYLGSSLVFWRERLLSSVGFWDAVHYGAGEEMVGRIRAVHGQESVDRIEYGGLIVMPLEAGKPRVPRLEGARQEYRDAFRHHHRSGQDFRYRHPMGQRPFAVPVPLLPNRSQGAALSRKLDVVIATDYRMIGGSTMSSLEEVKAHKRLGLRTGLVQLPHYAVGPGRGVLPEVREVIDGNQVQMVTPEEEVKCDVMLVRYPPVLQEWRPIVPRVEANELRIIVNQPPLSYYGQNAGANEKPRYDIPTCATHVSAYFGKPGVWQPIGPLVRATLEEHHSSELSSVTLAAEDWVNIIDVAAWRRPSRPINRLKPKIGRHSRDHAVKWPADANEILSAYPVSSKYEVHILGGGEVVRQRIGYLPDNWHVKAFGEIEPREFLMDLDVFVYFTHADWIESFGRVILEAMATGVPTVLPWAYRELFGDAAIYTEPAGVLDVVDALMSDESYYDDRVEAALDYVETNFGYSMHANRLGLPDYVAR